MFVPNKHWLLIVFSLLALVARPEGWKELRPGNISQGQIYWSKNSWCSSNPSVSPENKIHIKFVNPGEKMYYGFNWQSSYTYIGIVRILDPNGNPLKSDTLSTNIGPGWINNYNQAVAGPDVINPSGYSGFEFTPDTPGDYMFDIGVTDPILAGLLMNFDVTVVDTTITPLAPINGRVYCQTWYINCPQNEGFKGTLYGLPNDSIVTSINLNGIRGLILMIAMNHNGVYAPPMNWTTSRMSVVDAGYWDVPREYKIFLNDPDSLVYPTGILGSIQAGSLAVTPDCDGTVNIGFNVNKAGTVEVQIQIDPDQGIQPVDVILSDSVNPGANTIVWNGINGLGQPVPNGTPFSIAVYYLNGLTNLPLCWVDDNWNGFIVQLHRPSGPTPLIYWDDRKIDTTKYNFTGCVSSLPSTGCHSWWDPPYYWGNIVNSWWYTSTGKYFSPATLFKRSFHEVKDTTICAGDTIIWRSQPYFTAGSYTLNYPSVLTGCDSAYTLNLAMTPGPVVNLGNDTTICSGQSITLDAGACPGCTYQWANLTTGQPNIGNNQTYTTNQAGIYSVIVTGSNGCSGRDTLSLFTGQPVVISDSIAASANPVCEGIPVIFTSYPVNPGSSPFYQWKVNGTNAGLNSIDFTYTPSDGDVITCELLSSLTSCLSANPVISNPITMVVTSNLLVSISISATANPVCVGTPVIFTAMPTHGGSSPQFLWIVNGMNVGTNSPIYSYIPANGDQVSCTLTSSETCTINNPVTSNLVSMTVSDYLPVGISISASANPFCPGSAVIFYAAPINEGTVPQYQWKVNGLSAGANSSTFTFTPSDGDQVKCVLASSLPCTTNNPATSNTITMVINTSLPAGVSITAVPNPFCPGAGVTFTALPANGGNAPIYQWKVNGLNAGSNSPTYNYFPIAGDSVRCIMTSNLNCVYGSPSSSNTIILSTLPVPVVTFTPCFDTITTTNAKPIRLKGGIPLGGAYSGPGVSVGVFNPAVAGPGTKTITYTYTNVALCTSSATCGVRSVAPPAFSCGNVLTDIRDNQSYPTIQIVTQCWFARNLNYGIPIPSNRHQRDNCIGEKYCYQDQSVNCNVQGAYYQWDEIMLYDDTPGLQGVCPPGWHVPSEADWNTLFANWGSNGYAGSPLKYDGYSGFNALLVGVRHQNRQWNFTDFATLFWSSTAHGPDKAWGHGLNEYNHSVSFYPSLRSNAFSVRCLKDN